MSTTQAVVLVVVALVVVAAAVWLTTMLRRRRRLQERFGDEYEIVLDDHGSRRQTDRELAAREARHEQLNIRPLDRELRLRYAEQWQATQAGFVDDPGAALEEAQRLVEEVLLERGYPIGDVDRQIADLSVEHSDVLSHYRSARDASEDAAAGRTTTEHLRRGMVHYRALFAALLEDHAEAPNARL